MIDFRSELDVLIKTKLGLPVDGLHFVSRDLLGNGGGAALEIAGLARNDQVMFELQDVGYGVSSILQGLLRPQKSYFK